jgi:hypothetical protein
MPDVILTSWFGCRWFGIAALSADPPGLCLDDTVCAREDKQCDIMNKTQVLRCSGGIDSSNTYGRCIPQPPPPPVVTPCERCSRCLAAARLLVASTFNASTATPTTLSTDFYSWCSGRGYALASCRAVQTAITSSMKGNLARRAGALCQRLEDCAASVALDASCALSVAGVGNNTAPVAGRLDMCTVEGVSAGQQVAGLGESCTPSQETVYFLLLPFNPGTTNLLLACWLHAVHLLEL